MPRAEHTVSSRQIVQKERRKFARDMREWRAGKGMTLQEAADKFGVSRGLIQGLESGKCAPSFEVAIVVCGELGTTIPAFAGRP